MLVFNCQNEVDRSFWVLQHLVVHRICPEHVNKDCIFIQISIVSYWLKAKRKSKIDETRDLLDGEKSIWIVARNKSISDSNNQNDKINGMGDGIDCIIVGLSVNNHRSNKIGTVRRLDVPNSNLSHYCRRNVWGEFNSLTSNPISGVQNLQILRFHYIFAALFSFHHFIPSIHI